MAFQVEEYAYELIATLQPLVVRVRRQDKSLADQLSRAATSIALNIAEANGSDPGNRRARFFTASGSAKETRAALRSGVSGGTSAQTKQARRSNCSTESALCCGASRGASSRGGAGRG